jgi:hypothetical protein
LIWPKKLIRSTSKKLQHPTLWWFQDNREFMSYSLNELYRTIGVSKLAVQQARKRQDAFDLELAELVMLADQLKEEHHGCGVEKMCPYPEPQLDGKG